jgi:hypothetical protein
MARLSHLAGGLWLRKLDNCEIKSCSPERKPLLLNPVLCELGKVDRRKKSRENREQLRCCNWIRLPYGPIPEVFGGEGGKKVRPASAEPEARSQNICPVHLIRL